jgi:hypothetical protein
MVFWRINFRNQSIRSDKLLALNLHHRHIGPRFMPINGLSILSLSK